MATALETFKKTMERANNQIALYRRLSKVTFVKEPKKLSPQELSDVLRTGLVLGVAAFDAYFTDRFSEGLVPHLRMNIAPGRDLVDLMQKAGLDTKAALELLGMERPYRRIRTLVEHYLDCYVAQRMGVIDTLFVGFGLKGLSENAEKRTGRRQLRRSIEIAIQRRHDIVHAGDLDKHGKLKPIDDRKIERRLKDMTLFVNACESIISKKA